MMRKGTCSVKTVTVLVFSIVLSLVTACAATTYVVQPDGLGDYPTI